jgi:hypothetical protein
LLRLFEKSKLTKILDEKIYALYYDRKGVQAQKEAEEEVKKEEKIVTTKGH